MRYPRTFSTYDFNSAEHRLIFDDVPPTAPKPDEAVTGTPNEGGEPPEPTPKVNKPGDIPDAEGEAEDRTEQRMGEEQAKLDSAIARVQGINEAVGSGEPISVSGPDARKEISRLQKVDNEAQKFMNNVSTKYKEVQGQLKEMKDGGATPDQMKPLEDRLAHLKGEYDKAKTAQDNAIGDIMINIDKKYEDMPPPKK